MASPSKNRRWLAGTFLALALLMLALGLTALSDWLANSLTFVIYWAACAGLTGLAAVVAMIDVVLLRRQLRHDQQLLIEQTLREAEGEAGEKPER